MNWKWLGIKRLWPVWGTALSLNLPEGTEENQRFVPSVSWTQAQSITAKPACSVSTISLCFGYMKNVSALFLLFSKFPFLERRDNRRKVWTRQMFLHKVWTRCLMVEMKALRTPSPGTHFAFELVVLILQRGGCWAASNSGTTPSACGRGIGLNWQQSTWAPTASAVETNVHVVANRRETVVTWGMCTNFRRSQTSGSLEFTFYCDV
jgi:hypothetical protein